MLVTVMQFLIDFWFNFFSKIIMTLLRPILDKLVEWGALPTNYLTVLENFIDNLIDYIKFARQSIINITGIPSQIFSILMIFLLFVFSLHVATFSIKALLNVWAIFRTGRSMYNTKKK